MAMSTYETRLRGARKRLVEALDHAMEPDAMRDIEAVLGTLNKLLGIAPKAAEIPSGWTHVEA